MISNFQRLMKVTGHIPILGIFVILPARGKNEGYDREPLLNTRFTLEVLSPPLVRSLP
jgi:hypothetical protein